jgi:phosphoglycolate phosphatase
VTNKPSLPARLLLSHFAIDRWFEVIASPDDPIYPFSDKGVAVAQLLHAKGIDSADACVIGDAVDDARAAFVNRVAFIAAAYGYGEAHKQQTFPISRYRTSTFRPSRLLPETSDPDRQRT